MDKSTHEEHLSQPLQTNSKQFRKAVTFLTGYNGIFNVTNSKNEFYFMETITDEDGYKQITRLPCASELENLNIEFKWIIIDEEHYTESNYPFTIKPNFSTIGSSVELTTQGPVNTFAPDDSIKDLLGFNESTILEEYNLSQNPLNNLSFDNIFLECKIAQGMIFKGKQSGIIHKFTIDVDPGYKYIENFRGNVQWYTMDSKKNFQDLILN